MRTTTLRMFGGSTVVVIPPAMLEQLGLSSKTKVSIRVEDGRLVIEPYTPPRFSLSELMAQCDLDKRLSKAEREWMNASRVGREV